MIDKNEEKPSEHARYAQELSKKNDYLMGLVAKTANAPISGGAHDFSFSNDKFYDNKGVINLTVFDDLYEHYTIKLDRRLGIVTNIDVNSETNDRTFVRRQVGDELKDELFKSNKPFADLVGLDKPTEYAAEVYIILAAKELKTAMQFVDPEKSSWNLLK